MGVLQRMLGRPDKPKPVSAFLPWCSMRAPNAIAQETGSFQRSYTLRAADPMGLPPEILGARAMQANDVLRRFGGQWMIHLESQRRRVRSLPPVAYRYAALAWIDRCRRTQLLERDGCYDSTYFCTLTYTPPSAMLQDGLEVFMTGDKVTGESPHEHTVADFVGQADYFMALLSGMLAECRPLTAGETFTYLHSTVSDRWHEVGTLLCWDNLGAQLATTPFYGGWYPSYGDPRLPETWHLRFCSITGFPHRSMVGIMRALDLAQVEYRWVVRGKGLNKAGQEQFLKRQQHGWGGEEKSMLSMLGETFGKGSKIANTGAVDFAEDIDAARRETWYDLAAYADFTTTIMTWGLTDAAANSNVLVIRQAIEDQGFLVKLETDEADAAWFSMQPGNSKDNVNLTPQSMMTLDHLAPGLSTASWRGPARDDWFDEQSGDGLPWLYAVSPGQSLIRLVNHIFKVGHFLLLGATQTGKSTLLNLLRAAWMQYDNAQAMLFDLDRHGRLLTYLLGGYWHDLGAVGARYAPFQGIDDETHRALVLEWVLDLLRDYGQVQNAIMVAHVGKGLEKLAAQPPLKRTMTTLLHILIEQSERATITAQTGHRDAAGFANPNAALMAFVAQRYELHKTLEMFTDSGQYQGLFDAATDDLTSHPVQTFEMRTLLNRSSILAPVLRYVRNLHLEPQMSTDRPMLLMYEDAAVVWMAESMDQVGTGMDAKKRQDKVKEDLQTAAKKGVSVGYSTHTLREVFGGAFGTILKEACPSVFYMPNEEALSEDIYAIYRRLGLEDPAIQVISRLRRQRDVYLTVRGHGQQVLHFPHTPEVLACLARNSAADHARMDRLMADVGRDGFAPAWMRSEGMEDAAVFFEEFRT